MLIADIFRSIVRVDCRCKESLFLVSAHFMIEDGIAIGLEDKQQAFVSYTAP